LNIHITKNASVNENQFAVSGITHGLLCRFIG
jgi:hypothetical protein